MKVNEIERLLTRYYDGETSETEEKELKRFFTEEDVPAHLLAEKEIFMQLAAQPAPEIPEGLESRLSLKGYDELMRVNDEGEKVRVLMKTKKETIRELLFVCTGKEDCTLVQINGKFTKDDINKLVNQETGKKHGHR